MVMEKIEEVVAIEGYLLVGGGSHGRDQGEVLRAGGEGSVCLSRFVYIIFVLLLPTMTAPLYRQVRDNFNLAQYSIL